MATNRGRILLNSTVIRFEDASEMKKKSENIEIVLNSRLILKLNQPINDNQSSIHGIIMLAMQYRAKNDNMYNENR